EEVMVLRERDEIGARARARRSRDSGPGAVRRGPSREGVQGQVPGPVFQLYVGREDVRLEEGVDGRGLRRVLDQEEIAARDGHGELRAYPPGGREQQGSAGSTGPEVGDVRRGEVVQPLEGLAPRDGYLAPGG